MTPGPVRRAEEVLKQAKARRLTLATVESCTAGALGLLLADAPARPTPFTAASSSIPRPTRRRPWACRALLSRPIPRSAERSPKRWRAAGIERCPADIAVAVTGVAGPEPDEDGNPVGLIHLAAACRDGRVSHIERNFGQNRAREPGSSLEAALGLIEPLMRAPEEPRRAVP